MSEKISVDIDCGHCNKTYSLSVVKEDLEDWMAGNKLVQEALPYLTAGERELLISQTCDDCWNEKFGFIEEDEDEEENDE